MKPPWSRQESTRSHELARTRANSRPHSLLASSAPPEQPSEFVRERSEHNTDDENDRTRR
jgi:hypothetical protein